MVLRIRRKTPTSGKSCGDDDGITAKLAVMDSADSHIKPPLPVSFGAQPRLVWQASPLALLLPGLVVAVGYGALWAVLHLNGRGEGALARVCLLVLIIVVPLLLAYAALRLSTTRLTLRGAHLEAHPGFPTRDPVTVSYPQVSGLSLRRGLSGWITGAGSLVIERTNGAPVTVSGLSSPDAALSDLSARCEAFTRSDAAR